MGAVERACQARPPIVGVSSDRRTMTKLNWVVGFDVAVGSEQVAGGPAPDAGLRAIEVLAAGDTPITRIAFTVGYTSLSHSTPRSGS